MTRSELRELGICIALLLTGSAIGLLLGIGIRLAKLHAGAMP